MKKTLSFLLVLAMVLSSFTAFAGVDTVAAEVQTHKAYIAGISDDTFAPKNNVTRQQVARMIAVANGLEKGTPEFKDANQIGNWAKDSVGALQKAGIVVGDEKGNFNPKDEVKRSELAMMLVKAYENIHGDIEAKDVSFQDVADDAWYAEAVKKAATVEIVAGVGNDKFNPNGNATREQAVAMVNRMLGLDKDKVENIDKLETEFKDVKEWSDWAKEDILLASTDFNFVEKDGKIVIVTEDVEEVKVEELEAVIAKAEKAAEDAVVGEKDGNYPKEAVDALKAAIKDAKAVLENKEATQEEVDKAAEELTAAIKTFEEKVVVVEELKVEEVSAINSSAIQVVFNQKVDKSTIKLSNFYVGLTKDSSANDIETLNPGRYDIGLLEDGKTVIISGKDVNTASANTNVIWADDYTVKPTGVSPMLTVDGPVVKDRTVYIQMRNIRTADGKLASAMEDSFYSADTTRPDTVSNTILEEDTTPTEIEVAFDEPVNIASAKAYLNSTLLDDSGALIKYKVAAGGEVDHSTLVIGLRNSDNTAWIEQLKDGDNTLELVGVKDFSGNATTPNNKKLTVRVAESAVVAPKFLGLEQAHDAGFYLYFDKKVDTIEGKIKNLKNDNVDFTFDMTTTTDYQVLPGTKLADGTWEYLVEFDNDVSKEAAIYAGSNEIIRTVELNKYAVGSKEGVKHSKAYSFKKDRIAPKVVKAVAIDETIEFTFEDAPFDGDVEVGTPTKPIVLRRIDDQGLDVVVEIPSTAFLANGFTVSGKKATLDLGDNSLVSAVPDIAKLTTGTELKSGITAQLPYGLVKDTNNDTTPQYTTTSFIGATINVVGGVQDEVPVVETTTSAAPTYNSTTKTIEFVVKGKDINASTVRNQANYTLNGKALTSASKIEAIKDTDGLAVKIYLEKNTIERAGAYEFTVKNIATNSGAKMLPTKMQLAGLEDNTQPQIAGAKLVNKNTVEVTFNEDVAVTAAAKDNFFVHVNGARYSVTGVKQGGNAKVLVLTISQDIEYAGKTLKLEIKNTVSDDMFVEDLAGNKAVEQQKAIVVDVQ